MLVGNRYDNNPGQRYLLFVSETNVQLFIMSTEFDYIIATTGSVGSSAWLEVSYNGSMVTIGYRYQDYPIPEGSTYEDDRYLIDSNGNLIAQGSSTPLTKSLIPGPTENLVNKSFYNDGNGTTYLFTSATSYIKSRDGSFENGSYTITGPYTITMDFDSWTVTYKSIRNSSRLTYGIVTIN
jgi:hypothetical protein